MRSADNPLGLDGFEFVEFTSPDPAALKALFEQLGFVARHVHPSGALTRYTQGHINILINEECGGHSAEFREAHGPSASAMAFRVADADEAYQRALMMGAKPANAPIASFCRRVRAIEGIGGAILYLVDSDGVFGSIYDCWTPVPGAEKAERANAVGLLSLDHLTHNVERGHMRDWSGFYNRIFGFEEQKYFDIKGRATGLFSQAMIAPDNAIRIPLNESQDDQSQIEEFLRAYRGEGIQHLAFTTDDIYATVEALRARGVKLQDTPDTYYEQLDARVPGHGEDKDRLKANRILLDGDTGREGLLLQIFTETMVGPIFFEIIQRKGNEGFGNGNFQALFESIELDQIRRGAVRAA
ncbi:MAG TPA: 4-hydroxyphenylpyruvate dioxygenase [Caulobacteraceae bacterium]|nr:4-hydroxyphenylpyruvate dioxygenase [Caulobacteraceae bacterium]